AAVTPAVAASTSRYLPPLEVRGWTGKRAVATNTAADAAAGSASISAITGARTAHSAPYAGVVGSVRISATTSTPKSAPPAAAHAVPGTFKATLRIICPHSIWSKGCVCPLRVPRTSGALERGGAASAPPPAAAAGAHRPRRHVTTVTSRLRFVTTPT